MDTIKKYKTIYKKDKKHKIDKDKNDKDNKHIGKSKYKYKDIFSIKSNNCLYF